MCCWDNITQLQSRLYFGESSLLVYACFIPSRDGILDIAPARAAHINILEYKHSISTMTCILQARQSNRCLGEPSCSLLILAS